MVYFTYFRDLQPTYIGAIHLLRTMDIPVRVVGSFVFFWDMNSTSLYHINLIRDSSAATNSQNHDISSGENKNIPFQSEMTSLNFEHVILGGTPKANHVVSTGCLNGVCPTTFLFVKIW